MCITEYTQENADMLREIETQRRIDEEKQRTESEKNRADKAEAELARYKALYGDISDKA